MEFDEMLISTGVDALIKLVREKGKIDLTLASKLLNIQFSTIEEWAHALESEGIISIEYQLTKVYLKWVSPTEEKISEERAALTAGKAQLVEQIKALDEKSKEQSGAVQKLKDEFSQSYGKLSARLDEIGKKAATLQHLKGGSEEGYFKAAERLEELRTQIAELRDSIASLRDELEKTKSELSSSTLQKKVAEMVGSRERISAMKQEFEALDKQVAAALEALSSKKLDASSLQQSLSAMRFEFSDFMEKMESQREVLKDAESLSQLISNAKKEIEDVRAEAKAALSELAGYKGTVSELGEKVSDASARMDESSQRAAHIEESLRSAQETFSHLSTEKGEEEMRQLAEEAKALRGRMDKLQADAQDTLPLLKNADKLASSLSELRKKANDERKRLAEESGAIFASLDEEISTYSTFQKIKEKALANINGYLTQLEKIEAQYEDASKSVEDASRKLDETLSAFRESGEYKDAEELSNLMDSLAQKRQALEEIKAGISSLEASAERTARQVKLLSKEAEILEMRAGTSVPESREQVKRGEGEIRESISLTEAEQREFDAKRDELRKLIKKLWEEE